MISVDRIKRHLRHAVAGACRVSGVSLTRNKGRVAILTYHRVLTRQEINTQYVQPGMYVFDETFHMHMEYLRRHFKVLAFADLLDRWQQQEWDHTSPQCVITFDDGWLDNYRNAYPILKDLRLPATIFLPTDFIGTSRWFWPERLGQLLLAAGSWSPQRRQTLYASLKTGLRTESNPKLASLLETSAPQEHAHEIIEACKDLDYLYLDDLLMCLCKDYKISMPGARAVIDWEEIREMSGHGISFGSHSCSHRLLDRLSQQDCRKEALKSYEALKTHGVSEVPVFCYPNGNFSATTKEAVCDVGYQAAVSSQAGLEEKDPSDRFALRRVSPHQDISWTPSLFAFSISNLW